MINKPFYVYVLLRPNGSPFYVGKGSGKRKDDHEAEARRACECHRCRVIRKVWRSGKQIVKSIVYSTHREADAYRVEAELIASIGLRLLANVQPGHSGVIAGAVVSQRDPLFWSEHERRYYLRKGGCSKKRIDAILRAERQLLIEELQGKRKGAIVRGEVGRLAQIDDDILALRLSLGYTSFIKQHTLWEE